MKNNLYKLINNYKTTKSTNVFIYFLSHTPILKKFFHSDLVSEYESKEGINIAVESILFLWSLLKKVLYILLLSVLFTTKSSLVLGITILTICGIINKKINEFNILDYDAINLLKINPKKYGKYKINSYLIKEFILMSLAMLSLRIDYDFNILFIELLVLVYLSIHIIGESLYIKKLEKDNIKTNKFMQFLLLAFNLSLAIITCIFEIELNNIILFILFGTIVFLGIYSYLFLIKYNKYTNLYKYNLSTNKIISKKIKKNSVGFSENPNSSYINNYIDMSKNDDSKKGYEYLHNTFLNRYKLVIRNNYILGFVLVFICCLVLIFSPIFIKSIDNNQYSKFIFEYLTSLFFIMYIIAESTKSYINICFFQVDRYLINYNFYRSEKALDKNLKLRLKSIFKYSMPSALLISFFLALTMIIYSAEFNITRIFVVICLPIVLSLFYSLYHISAYYLLQPYSFDGTIVNKGYKMVDGTIYLIAYALFSSSIIFDLSTLIIIIFILFILSIILYLLVIKKGSKTFRVK